MTIKWAYEEKSRKRYFAAKCSTEIEAIDLEADVFAWLTSTDSRAVKTLELRRIFEQVEIRDRTRFVYSRYRKSDASFEVALHFTNDAEAVAFKLKFC
jgi:tRNA splicing endonuclease